MGEIKKHRISRLVSAFLRAILSFWGIADIWLAHVQPELDLERNYNRYLPDAPNATQLVVDCLHRNPLVDYEDWAPSTDDENDDGFNLIDGDYAGRFRGVNNREALVYVGMTMLLAEIFISIATAYKTNDAGEAPPNLIALDAMLDLSGLVLASLIASKTSHSYEVIDSFSECFPSKDSVIWASAKIPEEGDIGGAYTMAVVIAITQCGEFVDKMTEAFGGMVE